MWWDTNQSIEGNFFNAVVGKKSEKSNFKNALWETAFVNDLFEVEPKFQLGWGNKM